MIQNVDKNQGNITCETCDKFIKMDVPWKKSSNQIIYIPVEDKKDESSDKSGMGYTKSEKLRKRRKIDKIAKQGEIKRKKEQLINDHKVFTYINKCIKKCSTFISDEQRKVLNTNLLINYLTKSKNHLF